MAERTSVAFSQTTQETSVMFRGDATCAKDRSLAVLFQDNGTPVAELTKNTTLSRILSGSRGRRLPSSVPRKVLYRPNATANRDQQEDADDNPNVSTVIVEMSEPDRT